MSKGKIVITCTALAMCLTIIAVAIKSFSSFISLNDIYNQNTSINIQSNVIQENYKTNGDSFVNAINIGNKTINMKKTFDLFDADRTGSTRYYVQSCVITKQCNFAEKMRFFETLNLTPDGKITTDYSFIIISVKIENLSNLKQMNHLNNTSIFFFDNNGEKFDDATEIEGYDRNFENVYKKDYYEFPIEAKKSEDIRLLYVIKDSSINKIKDMYIMFNPDGMGYPVSDNIKFVKAEYEIVN